MTNDTSAMDTARAPEREALGASRRGTRATARKATKKAGSRKTTAEKTAAEKTKAAKTAAGKATASGKTARKTARTAAKPDKPASTGAAAPATGTAATRASTARPAKPAKPGARPGAAAAAAEPAGGTASEGLADASAAPAAPPREPGPSIEATRPPAPMHPGASMDPMQEQGGGMGNMLALWGPLIIVGFLVLVFRGGDDRPPPTAAATDTPAPAQVTAPADNVQPSIPGSGVVVAGDTRSATPAPGMPAAERAGAEAFDRGFHMRTSMASPPAFAGHGSSAGMPAAAGRPYPAPPGPYRDPRYRGLATGESWPAAGTGGWGWPGGWRAPVESPEGPSYEQGADAPTQWVPCAPPYYWCPAPINPAW